MRSKPCYQASQKEAHYGSGTGNQHGDPEQADTNTDGKSNPPNEPITPDSTQIATNRDAKKQGERKRYGC
jgi:hypothetical protein